MKIDWKYGDKVRIVGNHAGASSYVGEKGIFVEYDDDQVKVKLESGRERGKIWPFWLDEIKLLEESN